MRGWTILLAASGMLLASQASARSYEGDPLLEAQPDESKDQGGAPAPESGGADEAAPEAAPLDQPEAQPEDEPEDEPPDDNHGAALMTFSAKATHTAVLGGQDERSHFGLGASGVMAILHAEDGMTARFQHAWSLGGGGAGFEGRLRGLLTFGVAPFDHDTPFVRAGLGGGLEGNDAFYFSHFELPVGEAGFHHSSDAFVLELGGRAAATLTSRYRGAYPTLRGGIEPSWGAFTSLYVGPVVLDATMMRIEQQSPLTAGWGHLCVADQFSMCVDGALYHAEVLGRDVLTSYVGLSLGIGYGGPWSRDL